MHIVTDSGVDLALTSQEQAALNIHTVPLVVTLEGKAYREGIDITPEAFYPLLEASRQMPTTSQPSAGDFAKIYRELAAAGEEILSIQMSSGLSGTYNSALAAAALVPEAHITYVDTKTLSGAAGWQVEAAARAVAAGWPLERVLALVQRISDATDCLFTLKELKYLIHGGRISHMKGLIASALRLKPLIGVEKVGGTYAQHGQVRTFSRALEGVAKLIAEQHPEGSALRVEVTHSLNPEGGQMLREILDARFDCTFVPMRPMSLVLGAHTGPSMVGVAYAPAGIFDDVP